MIKEEQKAEMNKLIKKIKRKHIYMLASYYRGNYEKVLKFIEKAEQLIKRFQGDLPEEIKVLHTRWLLYRSLIYAYRGNLALSFKEANELLRVAQLYGHKMGISMGLSALGRYYWLFGDLDKALAHCDRAIELNEENLNDPIDFLLAALNMFARWTLRKITFLFDIMIH